MTVSQYWECRHSLLEYLLGHSSLSTCCWLRWSALWVTAVLKSTQLMFKALYLLKWAEQGHSWETWSVLGRLQTQTWSCTQVWLNGVSPKCKNARRILRTFKYVYNLTCCLIFTFFGRMKRKFYSWEECMNLREVKVWMMLIWEGFSKHRRTYIYCL